MAEGLDVFKARITASDGTSSVLDAIKAHARALGIEFDEVGRKVHKLHRPAMWEELREHTKKTGEGFGELGEHVSGVGEKISDLLPAIGALGAVGGAAALAETVEHVAESYGQLAHTAQELGVSAQQLHQWNIVATLSETNADAMAKSMNRLNITLAEAAHGKAKEAAALFAHLHLDPKNFHDAAAALAPLADAFQHTQSAATRAAMAATLFGARAGKEMLPLLMRGSAGIRELQAEARKLGFDFSHSAEGLEDYQKNMLRLGVAADGFRDAVGAGLAPVLAPMVEEMTNWVAANRDWIATDIVGEVRGMVPLVKEVGDDIGIAVHYAEDFVHMIGGARVAVDLLVGVMALKTAGFLVAETAQMVVLTAKASQLAWTLGTKLVGAWGEVTGAAEVAETAEIRALEIGQKAAAGGGFGPGFGAGKLAVKGVALGALAAGAALDAQSGVGLTQDLVRQGYGKGLTAAQIAALPKHGGADNWANSTFGDTPDGQSYIGHQASRAWHGLFGGGSDTVQIGGAGFGGPGVTRLGAIPDRFVPAPSSGAPWGAQPPPPGKAEVKITFVNTPAGAKTSAVASGNVAVEVGHENRAYHDLY